MKKVITLLAVLTVFLSSYSAPLDPAQALQRVTGSSKIAPALGKKIQSPQLVLTGKTDAGQPAYYVFTNTSGTLYVSADDTAVPLLGYSESGAFDPNNMPPQLEWWLEQYAKEIEYASHIVQNGNILNNSQANTDAKASSMAAIAPLLTTTWDQSSPYNKYCPTISGERAVTGCVATSMAQVMNYHQWPQSQVPAISYVYGGQTLKSPATTIDWDNMLDSYSKGYTTTQANAVARLMQVAGYSVKMQYNTASNGGSGASSQNIREALVNTFSYDVSADYTIRDYYETSEWEQMIYDNLLNCGPVIYNGTGSEGGHSFVCDGYDGKGAFHMNWGWSGISDGYFVLSALNPGALGAGGGAGGFNYGQGAVLGLQKPQEGSVAPSPYIACTDIITGEISGRILTLKTEDPDEGFYNYGFSQGRFTFGVMLENTTDNSVSYIQSNIVNYNLDRYYGFSSYSVNIPTTTDNGQYRVYPTYKLASGEWQKIKLYTHTPQYLTISVTSDGISFDDDTAGEISLMRWKCPTGFVVEEEYEGYLTISNTFSTPKTMTLDAYLCKIENNSYHIYARLGSSTVTIPAKSEADMVFSGVLSKIDTGTYYLVFAQDGSNVVGSTQVEVTESSGEFSISRITATPEVLVPGELSTVEVVVESSYNKAKQFEMGLYLCSLKNNSLNINIEYGSQIKTISPNSKATFSFSTTIPDSFADGEYYLVLADPNTLEIIDYTVVEVASQNGEFTISSVNLTPQVLVPGELSTVEAVVESSYNTDMQYDMGLYLCTLDDDYLHINLEYGAQSMTIAPNSSATFSFSTIIPGNFAPGEYYLVFADPNTLDIIDYLIVEVQSKITAIDAISADDTDGSCRYYNLQGVEVAADKLVPGIYIRRTNNKSEKIIVK